MRTALQLAGTGCLQLVLDLRAVVSADDVSIRLLGELRVQLSKLGVRLKICQPGPLESRLLAAGFTNRMLFATEDAVLEACEDALIMEVTGAPWRTSGTIALEDCFLFRNCTAEDLALISRELSRRRYQTGDGIITAGDAADEMLVLLEGSARSRSAVKMESASAWTSSPPA